MARVWDSAAGLVGEDREPAEAPDSVRGPVAVGAVDKAPDSVQVQDAAGVVDKVPEVAAALDPALVWAVPQAGRLS